MEEGSESEVAGQAKRGFSLGPALEAQRGWKHPRCCFALCVDTWLLLKVHLFHKFLGY